MIYTDGTHLVGDSLQELHRFARSVGLKKEWFQEHPRHPHYDITTPRKLRKILNTNRVTMVSKRQIAKTQTPMNKGQNAGAPPSG